MTLDPREAALALHRFGFGPRRGSTSGSIAAIASDPQGALLAELEAPNAGQIVNTDLPTSGAEIRAGFEFNAARLAQANLERRRKEAAQATAIENRGPGNSMAAEDKPPAAPAQPNAVPPQRQIFLDEARARIGAANNADIGFVERLVWFWSNDFCVSADGTAAAGAYEREAIRPHVLGRFVDMLQAVESHPAMLRYLDNWQSSGPGSVVGINNKRGRNENLVREILELHTLGVRTVYTQADVPTFAKVLSGWTFPPVQTN